MASVRKRTWTHNGQVKEAWVVNYTDGGGKRRIKTFDKKKDADKHRTKVETEIESGSHTPERASKRVSELLDLVIANAELRREAGRRMGTSHLRSTSQFLNNYVRPAFGTRLLISIKWQEVDAWAKEMLTERKLALSTVKRALHIFKVAVDFAIRREWCVRNPVAEAMKEWRGGHVAPIVVPTKEEVQRILLFADQRGPKFRKRNFAMLRCFVHIGVFCGLRRGEICGLTLANLDLLNGVIQVRHNLTEWDEHKETKTRSGVRDVPMPRHLVDMLRDWIEHHYIPEDRGLVFRTSERKALVASHFHGAYWKPLLERAGLAPAQGSTDWLHFHSLRHFYASMLADRAVPLPEIASLLGHAKFDTTLQVYAHTIAGGNRRPVIAQEIAVEMLPTLAHATRMRQENTTV